MAPTQRKRQLLRVLTACLLVAVALVLLFPVWFPWILKPLAQVLGARFQSCQRLEQQELALQGFSFTNRVVDLQVGYARFPMPHAWLWRLRSTPSTNQHFLRASGVQLVVTPIKSGRTASVYSNALKVIQISKVLQRWVPQAFVTNASLRVEQFSLNIAQAHWLDGKLDTDVKLPQSKAWERLTADLSGSSPYVLTLHSGTLQADSTHQLSVSNSGVDVASTFLWRSNRAALTAHFGHQGIIPQTGALEIPQAHLPAALLRLPQYEGINASLIAHWDAGAFTFNLHGRTSPLPDQQHPPLQFTFTGRGDTNSAMLESASISAPWIQAQLSRNLQIRFEKPFLLQPAALRISADLDQQTSFPFAGQVGGTAVFWPDNGPVPRARFEFAGTNISHGEVAADALLLQGELAWPWLQLTNAQASFNPASTVVVSGRLDLDQRVIDDGSLTYQGPWANRWLPPGFAYTNAHVSASFHGPIRQLVHSGMLDISDLSGPNLKPAQLQAAWDGTHLSKVHLNAKVQRAGALLSTDSTLELSATGTNLTLHALSLTNNAQPVLTLSQPARISASPGGAPGQVWNVAANPVRLQGPGGNIELQGHLAWPLSGHLAGSMQGVKSSTWTDFLAIKSPPVEIESLNISGGWTNGPLQFDVGLKAAILTNQSIAVAADIGGGREGISIQRLNIAGPDSHFATATGSVPIVIFPGTGTNSLRIAPRDELRLRAKVETGTPLLDELVNRTGVKLTSPSLDLEIGGTWNAPEGRARVMAQQVQLQSTLTNLPSISQVDLSLEIDRNQVRLRNGEFFVDGQRAGFSGQIPLGSRYWKNVLHQPIPDWQQAQGEFLVEGASLAPFVGLVPDYLAPAGELSLRASVSPGFLIKGSLSLENARTRPFPSIGSVRDINIRANLNEHSLELTQATGQIGGSTVQLEGKADLRGVRLHQFRLPAFNLKLTGTNVPLSRRPESIIRSDLDLAIVRTNFASPLISGTAHLRDSLFLSDLADLVPGKVAAPARRPPYFSIETPPFNRWRLAVHVAGNRFLTVRSPLFYGQASANLQLQGTLQDPLALGDVTIDSGQIRFPFGNLAVQRGLVSLTSANPFQPQVALNAASRQFGYDVRLEVSGPAEAPLVQLSSTPPLSSEQILLMITAGEMPRGEQHFTARHRGQTLALFLGKDVLAKLGFGDSGEQRLTLRSGEELSESGRSTYSVEYKLTDRWSIVGEYDRFGDVNVGAKWKVYSK